MIDEKELREAAALLAKRPTASTKHMHFRERRDGIAQMLHDLNALARNDGCIAAAWALEMLVDYSREIAERNEVP